MRLALNKIKCPSRTLMESVKGPHNLLNTFFNFLLISQKTNSKAMVVQKIELNMCVHAWFEIFIRVRDLLLRIASQGLKICKQLL